MIGTLSQIAILTSAGAATCFLIRGDLENATYLMALAAWIKP